PSFKLRRRWLRLWQRPGRIGAGPLFCKVVGPAVFLPARACEPQELGVDLPAFGRRHGDRALEQLAGRMDDSGWTWVLEPARRAGRSRAVDMRALGALPRLGHRPLNLTCRLLPAPVV